MEATEVFNQLIKEGWKDIKKDLAITQQQAHLSILKWHYFAKFKVAAYAERS